MGFGRFFRGRLGDTGGNETVSGRAWAVTGPRWGRLWPLGAAQGLSGAKRQSAWAEKNPHGGRGLVPRSARPFPAHVHTFPKH